MEEILVKILVCFIAGAGAGIGTGFAGMSAAAVIGPMLITFLGIPAYEDAGAGYHYPNAENISSALRGISAADRHEDIDGIALYCEWEMDENKWQIWRKFIQ